MAQNAAEILKIWNQAKESRTPIQSHWQDAYDYTYPQLGYRFAR
ncbi:head-tail connector protein [Pantoea ananatis]|nr:head-tail connector protein [Pantoea ananatis]